MPAASGRSEGEPAPAEDAGTAPHRERAEGVPVRRLKTRAEFLKVADARTKWTMPGLVLQARRRETGPTSDIGIGFTVSKKVGNAVARNRARRRLRAAAAAVLPHAGRPGTDYVVIGRTDTLTRPFADLVADLATAVARVDRPRRRPDGDREVRP